MTIAIKDFDNAEVCIWLISMGLGSKIGPFKENDVDGDLLCSLGQEDLTRDLALSNLQAKKVVRGIESAKGSDNDAAPDTSHDLRIAQLGAENEQLQNQVATLKAQVQALEAASQPQAPPAPAPAPQQAPPPPPKKKQGPGVVGGAARGAAGGAAKGAVMGAILPGMDASDGAKAGAAVGAMSGGMRGARRRRR
jgi:hypothetical protein